VSSETTNIAAMVSSTKTDAKPDAHAKLDGRVFPAQFVGFPICSQQNGLCGAGRQTGTAERTKREDALDEAS
jgi:hypothetical protein